MGSQKEGDLFMFSVIYDLSVIGLGALGGSTLALIRFDYGIIGGIVFGFLFGLLSHIAEKRYGKRVKA